MGSLSLLQPTPEPGRRPGRGFSGAPGADGTQGEASGFQDAFAAFERDITTLLPQLDACMAEVL
jgi:hypothetical protein